MIIALMHHFQVYSELRIKTIHTRNCDGQCGQVAVSLVGNACELVEIKGNEREDFFDLWVPLAQSIQLVVA